ncbi:uncharacterized protein FOMMEDRAFT_18782 [Fomitiporia mediterranea MF3/22]|uniref:uncharacterized protein n=1 Tax=Fomitiporia mediterranea (strain MF3/22) TaxID=694068 RepID=UPI00044099A5|nr:uncharacterized protein FOMMEDRAFT_18782 [Fomitiporia mediterranea MF3/22]EJD05148.1 hypothetical protein FOMMEDRAFT_18782 [Fomitiporia mediterranea MF3/22]
MSRLIIKNLPPYITPPLLKQHFSQKDGPGGTLTDVQVAQTPDGRSRRFGFVGYKTEEEARKARGWFDRTFVGMTRIGVEVVEKGAKDAPIPRPNKKPRIDNSNSAVDKLPGTKPLQKSKSKRKKMDATTSTDDNAESIGKKIKKGAELDEFMQVMQPRTKKERTWANNDDVPVAGPSSRPLEQSQANANGISETDDSNEREEEDGVEEVDDMEWMRRKMKKDLEEGGEERVFMQDEEEEVPLSQDARSSKLNSEKAPEKADSEPSPTDTILQTGRLFLRNLSYTCTQSELEAHFSRFGDIAQVHIPLDPISKSSKGLAFVTFSDPACAVKAFEELDKTSFQGRLLHILPAAERKSSGVKGVEDNLGGSGKTSVKKEKEKKKKEGASKEFNWSMLYMNADAVASSIADRMNIPKADILNPDSENGDTTSAAVKLALAETHIIQETKAFLESEGIDLSAFSSLSYSSSANSSNSRAVRAKRSDTVILVKNIPYGTTSQQIRELFEPHGELRRVVVPPSGTIAVVEFAHPDDAGRGFRGVAYRRLGGSVVYLEKAPVGVFNGSRSSDNTTTQAIRPTPAKQDVDIAGPIDDAKEEEAPPGSTLFLKNLAFATTSERLTSVLRHLPGFSFARVQTKPDPKRPSIPGQPPPRLSMGFGFVGFTSKDAAKTALRSIQGLVVDGHALSVKFAGRGTEDQDHDKNNSSSSAKATSKTTKMIVKNLPFEATKSDLRSLFNTHGTLKSVRLPKKFNSHSRGYAFLEFTTRLEAERVFGAMMHTHLLGRHLVLEWAEDGGRDVEGLRRKAGVGFGDGSEMPGRKRKLEFGEEGDEVLDE